MLPCSCSFCSHENPAGSKYCNECGSPLHLMVCKCGAVNNVTDGHCYRCGASVVAPRASAPNNPPEAPLGDVDERRRAFERPPKAPSAEPATQHAPRFVADGPAPVPHFIELEQQPQVQMSSPGSPTRPGRRDGYLAAALVLAIVAAVATAVVSYDRYAPWLALLTGAPRAPVAAAPPPDTGVTASTEAATASPRPEMASPPMPAEPSRSDAPKASSAGRDIEEAGSLPASPVASTSQAADVPMESRAGGDAGKAPAPASTPPATDPSCPPAVAALNLCERMTHADRR